MFIITSRPAGSCRGVACYARNSRLWRAMMNKMQRKEESREEDQKPLFLTHYNVSKPTGKSGHMGTKSCNAHTAT